VIATSLTSQFSRRNSKSMTARTFHYVLEVVRYALPDSRFIRSSTTGKRGGTSQNKHQT
jgi:hypothetical protein